MANKTNVYFDIIASFVLQNSTGVNTSFSYGTLDPAQRASQLHSEWIKRWLQYKEHYHSTSSKVGLCVTKQ